LVAVVQVAVRVQQARRHLALLLQALQRVQREHVQHQ
jgi:hypothetical protein